MPSSGDTEMGQQHCPHPHTADSLLGKTGTQKKVHDGVCIVSTAMKTKRGHHRGLYWDWEDSEVLQLRTGG